MPVASGTPLNPEATKAKVLEVAGDLFYEWGVNRVGVNEIAARANASKLSIYRYFGSKQGLVKAVMADRGERTHRRIAARLATDVPLRAAPRDRALATFTVLLEETAEQPFHGCPVINTVIDTRGDTHNHKDELAVDETIRRIARDHLDRYFDVLKPLLEEAGAADAFALANALLLLIEGAVVISAVDVKPTALHTARMAADALIPPVH